MKTFRKGPRCKAAGWNFLVIGKRRMVGERRKIWRASIKAVEEGRNGKMSVDRLS